MNIYVAIMVASLVCTTLTFGADLVPSIDDELVPKPTVIIQGLVVPEDLAQSPMISLLSRRDEKRIFQRSYSNRNSVNSRFIASLDAKLEEKFVNINREVRAKALHDLMRIAHCSNLELLKDACIEFICKYSKQFFSLKSQWKQNQDIMLRYTFF